MFDGWTVFTSCLIGALGGAVVGAAVVYAPATLALTILGLVTGCALVCKWLDAADARRCRWAQLTGDDDD